MSGEKPISELWRYEEAAAFLRITPNHLRVLVMKRRVPFLKPFGRGRVLFDPQELAEFVHSKRVEPLAA